jgi:radical SAM protein (TIGR01212 family)
LPLSSLPDETAFTVRNRPLIVNEVRKFVRPACPFAMTATVDNRAAQEPAWRSAGLRYYAYNLFLRNKFGQRVQKVSLDAGFTCPNVDGTVAIGGCTFCDNRSFSPSRRVRRRDIWDQLDDGIRRLKHKYEAVDKFIAYFQPATNTYGPVDQLRELFERAVSHPKVVGLAIGTRPDCVPDDVLDLLQELAGRPGVAAGVNRRDHAATYLSVEYGIQTIHDRSLDWMNRGHHHDTTVDAIARSRGRGFEICGHVILGLPGESRADMLATAREVARLGLDAVKIHNLYAVKDTPLAEQVQRGEVTLMERDEYIATLVDFLELLAPGMIVERISGDAPPDYFLGPSWCLDKPATLRALSHELTRRDTWQGKRFVGP